MGNEIELNNLRIPEELTHYSYFEKAPRGIPICDKVRHDAMHTWDIQGHQQDEKTTTANTIEHHKNLLMATGVSPIDIIEITSGRRVGEESIRGYNPEYALEAPIPNRKIVES